MSAKLLAIDAATEACSVALQINGQVYHRYELCPQTHSQRLLPMIDEVLKEAGVRLDDLDALAFTQGPGSFTGVRIGVGVAQGLAFGADLPMVGVSTLQTMAQAAISQQGAKQVVAAIDARMGEVYTAQYDAQEGLACLVGEQRVVRPEVAEYTFADDNNNTIYGVGTGWQAYAEPLSEKVTVTVLEEVQFPHAIYMLPLAEQALANNLQVDAQDAQPVYVRDTVTWKKLPGR